MLSVSKRLLLFLSFFINLKSQSAAEAIHFLENEIGFGARSLSMGGAYTSLGNDPSGMYWNPAGLASIKSGVVYVETHSLDYNNSINYLNQVKENPLKVGRLNGFGITFPIPTIRGSLVLGMGFNRLIHYDQLVSFSGFSNTDNGLTFPINGNNVLFSNNVFREELIANTGSLNMWSFSFGIALAENLSGGLSLSRVVGDESYDFRFIQKDDKDNYNVYPSDFKTYNLDQKLITDIRSWNLTGGLKAIVSDNLQFGLSLSLPMTINIEEQHAASEKMIFDNDEEFNVNESGYYVYRIKTPMVIDFGLAFKINDFIISSGFKMKDWSKTKFDLKGIDDLSEDFEYFQSENIFLAKDYGLTMQVKIGAEYLLKISDTFGLNIRAGYNETPSPEKSTMQEEAIERISFGIGFPLSSNILINATLVNSNWDKISSDTYAPSEAIESVSAKKIFINTAYLF